MTAPVPARLFGPGLPPAGVNAMLWLSPAGVQVETGAMRLDCAITNLGIRAAGFGTPGIELAWSAGDDRWAVHVINPVDAEKVMSSPGMAASAQMQSLRALQRRAGRWRALGWAALVACFTVPLLLLVLFLTNADRIAEWVASGIPIDKEVEIGQTAFADLRARVTIMESGSAVDAVRTIGRRFTGGSRYDYRFHVATDDTLNAFALPGGIIVVHTGLIAATKRPEELAGVIAHEVQHVELRHSLVGMVKQVGLSALWSMATGELGGSLLGRAALELTGLKFSRDAESEADNRGLDALIAAGIDPSGMSEFFAVMEPETGEASVGFLSTHPLSTERRHQISERLKEHGNQHFEPMSIAPWPPDTSTTRAGAFR